MLKNTPRYIAFGLLLLFSLPIAVQQLASFLRQSHGVAEAEVRERATFTRWLESKTETFRWLDRLDYDLHLRASDPGAPSPDVAIVEVNERSLKDLGQFPFTRTVYKGLLERLEGAGARVVAFDATFPEQDSRREIISELRGLRHQIEQREGFDSRSVKQIDERIFALDADEDFATALHNSRLPVVLGFTFSGTAGNVEISRELRELLFSYDVHRRNLLDAGALRSHSGEVPVISIVELMRSLNEKGSIGHINPEYDGDGLIRSIPAVTEFDGRALASLSLRALAAYYGEAPLLDGSDGLTVVGGERYRFPLNPDGRFLLRYYGAGGVFPYTEFSDIVKWRISAEEMRRKFQGKIVFVGVTAVGLKDLRATPFASDYPGVETHATMASNVLMRRSLIQDNRFFLYGYLFLWAFGALVAWAVFRFHPLVALAITAACVATLQFGTHLLFFNRGVVVPSILPSLGCLGVFFLGVLYRYFTEEQEKKVVRAAFSRYVSGAVVEEILKDQSKLRLGGQKKELTVMFVDLVGFTKLSERMDAAFVARLLNEYFTRMTNVILRNGGTLDKYMGDAIMCFWGAPLENLDHARLACRTALEMRDELAQINREWEQKFGITIENRIGVHTGGMMVGNMGSDQVFSYTAMGDNVNLGARLEGVNTDYGTHVVVSAACRNSAGADFLFRKLDRVQVRGREDAVEVHELVGFRAEKEPEWVHAFEVALAHYHEGEWADAAAAFGACLALKPGDGPSLALLERIHDWRERAPAGWNGVWKVGAK